MPLLTADDGVRLHYEETGSGAPLVFVHEYGNDCRTWEPQLRFFGKYYRCVAFNARGFPPSDVPQDPARYSLERAVADLNAVIHGLGLAPCHVVSLAMGSFTTLFHSIDHGADCRAQVVAGCGYGADPAKLVQHHAGSDGVSALYETRGSAAAAEVLANGPARMQLKAKAPRAWEEFRARMATHSAEGAALTQRRVLRERAPLYAVADRLATIRVPTLLIAGDEDDPLLEANVFLKRTIPSAALAVFPRAGHTLNLEDPELFNATVLDFLHLVECGRWTERDPRSRHAP